MDSGAPHGRGDRGRQVSVADQFDPGPRGADVPNQVAVALPLEHHDGQRADRAVEGAGDRLQVVLHRRIQVDFAAGGRTDHDLVHVDVGGVEQAPTLGGGKHRHRIRGAGGAQVRSLQGIDREIDRQISGSAAADTLPDVEHRRLVPLPFADHDPAVDRHRRQRFAHRLDGNVVGMPAIAVAHRLRRRDGGRLGDGDEVVLAQIPGHEPPPDATAASSGPAAASRA